MAEENGRVTQRIRLWGVVQGVGFRPFAANLAKRYNITGCVANSGGMVEVIASGQASAVTIFAEELVRSKPSKAIIIHSEVNQIEYHSYDDFVILQSSPQTSGIILLSPDLPVCPTCLKEMTNPNNRRYMHPFISCTECGPRYSIIKSIPYDRGNTTMDDFSMCLDCNSEYTTPITRRYHAQTISCHDCGPFAVLKSNGQTETNFIAIQKSAEIIKNGGVIAIKGIGGYHLACSPIDSLACEKLRKIKNRDQKPFAVMFTSLDEIENHCFVSVEEKALLQSDCRPIVLLERKLDLISPQVYTSSRMLGCFLSYTSLHALLLQLCGPLVMTSANLSEQPIIYEDTKMLAFATDSLDGVLLHQRSIEVGLDDSVARVICGKPQFLRRGRGVTPLPLHLDISANDSVAFASGGQQKSSFCLYKDGYCFMSQHLGELDQQENINNYQKNLERMISLLNIKPQTAVCDLHPRYESSRIAYNMGLPVKPVQHHLAHIASVVAEHHINESIIGVAFDGTGYGTDGTIWGGEIFTVQNKVCHRAAHLKDILMQGGDLTSKQAWKSAFCWLFAAGVESEDNRFELVKKAIQNNINCYKYTGFGRLFDAVAYLLGLSEENHFEGECGMLLENLAANAQKLEKPPFTLTFETIPNKEIIIDPCIAIRAIIDAVAQGIDKERIALGFHLAVCDSILSVCRLLKQKQKINSVALSGGVFQNGVLMELTVEKLQAEGFKVYFNEQVPPNDGGIALGQIYAALNRWELKV